MDRLGLLRRGVVHLGQVARIIGRHVVQARGSAYDALEAVAGARVLVFDEKFDGIVLVDGRLQVLALDASVERGHDAAL